MDLFTPLVPEEQLHPNFRALLSPNLFESDRAVISTWAEGFVDRDRKFVKEFQTTFNSSFWELYLFACMKALGFQCDFGHDRPDFVARRDTGEVMIAEATIASNPLGYSPEFERDYDFEQSCPDMEGILDLATDRLGGAIWTKFTKYRNDYATLSHVKDQPFVICVAPFEQPFFFWQGDQAIRRVLYGVDELLYRDDPETETRVIYGDSRYEWFIKESGAKIPLAFFARPEMADVSAVIFSCTATISKVHALAQDKSINRIFFGLRYNEDGLQPRQFALDEREYSETLLDGLSVFLNPFTTRPIDPAWFARSDTAVHQYDPDSQLYWSQANDGFLFARQCYTMLAEQDAREVERRVPTGKAYKTRPRRHGLRESFRKSGGR